MVRRLGKTAKIFGTIMDPQTTAYTIKVDTQTEEVEYLTGHLTDVRRE